METNFLSRITVQRQKQQLTFDNNNTIAVAFKITLDEDFVVHILVEEI